jgi:hypothetical protein
MTPYTDIADYLEIMYLPRTLAGSLGCPPKIGPA